MGEEYYNTKELILEWKKKAKQLDVYLYHLDQLSDNATLEELQEARQLDQDFVENYISELNGLL